MPEIIECKKKEIPYEFRFITINNENNSLLAEVPFVDENGNYTIYSKRRKDGSKKEKYISFIIVPPSSCNIEEKLYLTNDLIMDPYGYYHQVCIKKNIYTYLFTNGKDNYYFSIEI
jgi:hypothetical protein